MNNSDEKKAPITLICLIVSTVIYATQAIIYERQYRLTAEQERIQLRAYLSAESPLFYRTDKNTVFVSSSLKNVGQTPARNVSFASDFWTAKQPEVNWIGGHDLSGGNGLQPTSDIFQSSERGSGAGETFSDIATFGNDDILVFQVKYVYNDVFNVRHSMEFCYWQFIAAVQKDKTGGQMCKDHNIDD